MKIFLLLFLSIQYSSYADEALVSLGERLFNDIRFSRYFYTQSKGDVNYKLVHGDPVLDEMQVGAQTLPSPFAGGAMSCASCHMVDQSFPEVGMRGYNDFSSQSKIPLRSDGKTHTPRNAPSLIGIGSPYIQNMISHWDGEFMHHRETVLGNFTGRNMGWLKNENAIALKNIANVIRKDKALDDLGREFGGAYSKIFLGTAQSIPSEFRIPKEHRMDVTIATNEEIVEKVIFFIEQYLMDLDFENENGVYTGSIYDEFLKLNGLPQKPKDPKDLTQYTQELTASIAKLANPKFIKPKYFANHKRSFGFGEKEYRGMRIFFNMDHRPVGQCVQCHMPPMFSDQKFHNIGTTQLEYEVIHGMESFNKLKFPKLKERNAKNIFYIQRPDSNLNKVDLGVWNFFARPNTLELTKHLRKEICSTCSDDQILEKLIGRVKTPSLRNLGHSAPYFHNGSAQSLEEAVQHYIEVRGLVQMGLIRNPSEHFQNMHIMNFHKSDLVAFLEALNENYE